MLALPRSCATLMPTICPNGANTTRKSSSCRVRPASQPRLVSACQGIHVPHSGASGMPGDVSAPNMTECCTSDQPAH